MLKTPSGLFRAFTPSLVEGQSRKVKGRSWAFKLLTLLLTLLLLLSLSFSAFARRPNHLRNSRDLDEQPHPGGVGNSKYFVVLKTVYGFVLIPVFIKSCNVSNNDTGEKPSASPRANESIE